LPRSRRPAVAATLLATRGAYRLWQVPTSGYLEVVDTTAPVNANNRNMRAVMAPYLASSQVAALRHPLVSFDGHATPAPSLRSDAPDSGPPGSVVRSEESLTDGSFTGSVHATRPAWVMLKESYSPRWTATVDGKAVPTAMVAPSFVGVPVPSGTHTVVFRYRPSSAYPAYFAIGAVTLVALVVVPVLWRRRVRPLHAVSARAEVIEG
jgi:hypothetical protein